MIKFVISLLTGFFKYKVFQPILLKLDVFTVKTAYVESVIGETCPTIWINEVPQGMTISIMRFIDKMWPYSAGYRIIALLSVNKPSIIDHNTFTFILNLEDSGESIPNWKVKRGKEFLKEKVSVCAESLKKAIGIMPGKFYMSILEELPPVKRSGIIEEYNVPLEGQF